MNSRQDIKGLVEQKALAVVGMSRSKDSFGAYAAKELKAKGYRLFPVNPNAAEILGETCYPTLAALPEKVGGALFLTPPSATEQAVREAIEAGVTHLWIQQGAESKKRSPSAKTRVAARSRATAFSCSPSRSGRSTRFTVSSKGCLEGCRSSGVNGRM